MNSSQALRPHALEACPCKWLPLLSPFENSEPTNLRLHLLNPLPLYPITAPLRINCVPDPVTASNKPVASITYRNDVVPRCRLP
ncbi:hypothetical protein D8674_031239 [Pyrus ussuriensis x Pyrus communis]|uniref:Uncharacterized protein n=1 Tax=Pyrus ussuriensis x Pyrus communis TaxID=2448454 RepID=A0A5N5EXZ9_9ROSA|nr:hypothetical protein D8674_031239 [Pyrus ussuriensis x Pyrus communis]